MGAEFIIDNLDDMCSLMCDNIIPKKRMVRDMKCKDCKYFKKSGIKAARSGWCMNEQKKVNGRYILIGCNAKACKEFKKEVE